MPQFEKGNKWYLKRQKNHEKKVIQCINCKKHYSTCATAWGKDATDSCKNCSGCCAFHKKLRDDYEALENQKKDAKKLSVRLERNKRRKAVRTLNKKSFFGDDAVSDASTGSSSGLEDNPANHGSNPYARGDQS